MFYINLFVIKLFTFDFFFIQYSKLSISSPLKKIVFLSINNEMIYIGSENHIIFLSFLPSLDFTVHFSTQQSKTLFILFLYYIIWRSFRCESHSSDKNCSMNAASHQICFLSRKFSCRTEVCRAPQSLSESLRLIAMFIPSFSVDLCISLCC